MFFDLLNIKAPAWYQTFIDGRRLTSMLYTLLHPTTVLTLTKQYIESREISLKIAKSF